MNNPKKDQNARRNWNVAERKRFPSHINYIAPANPSKFKEEKVKQEFKKASWWSRFLKKIKRVWL